jgi:hypothetical protein
VLGECTTEEQLSVVRICGQNDSMQRIFIKKYFLLRLQVSVEQSDSQLGGKRFADEEVEIEVRKWLRQKSKDFCAAGFHALVKRWDKCTNVVGGYVEK